MSRILVDTNVLAYAKDSSSIFHKSSLDLLKKGGDLFVTSKTISEYYAVVTKGNQPLLTPAEAIEDINEFISYCTLLFPNDESFRKLTFLTTKYKPKGLLIHDFEIAAIGLAKGINKIATKNKVDFKQIVEIEIIEMEK